MLMPFALSLTVSVSLWPVYFKIVKKIMNMIVIVELSNEYQSNAGVVVATIFI